MLQSWVGAGKAMLRGSVKIFIVAGFSNAMNPWEILPVPSLCRAIVPGLHTRLRQPVWAYNDKARPE